MKRALYYPLLFYFLFLFTSGRSPVLYAQFRTNIFGTAEAASVLVGQAGNIKSVLFDKKNILFDNEGYFIFGFDRDAKGAYILKVTFKDKKVETFNYNIDAAGYEQQAISGLQKKMVLPPKKERKRIAAESQIISSEKKKLLSGQNAFYKTGFIPPIDSAEITGVFGNTRILNGIKKSPHNGVDYSADEGEPVKAAGDGIVLVARRNFYYNGTFIMIDHGQGLTTNYLHLSKLLVKRGDKVSKGNIIGAVGSTGRSTGPHLHFGVQLFNKRIDPLHLLQLTPFLPASEKNEELKKPD
jgi:murein DD-endopeptidase MepM/ murein hydrolase activator NlpD